jgi:hypothetical protein
MIGGALVRRNKLDVADLVAQSRIGQAFEADSCSRCSPAAPDSIKLIANGSEVGDLAAHHPLHCGLPAKRKVRLVDPAVGVVRSLVDDFQCLEDAEHHADTRRDVERRAAAGTLTLRPLQELRRSSEAQAWGCSYQFYIGVSTHLSRMRLSALVTPQLFWPQRRARRVFQRAPWPPRGPKRRRHGICCGRAGGRGCRGHHRR